MNSLLSSGLLAASMLVGQPGEPSKIKPTPTPSVVQQQPMQRPILGWFNREDRPILGKLGSWWRREPSEPAPSKFVSPRTTPRETEAPPLINPPQPVPQNPNDFPRKLPNPQSKATPAKTETVVKVETKEVQQTSIKQATTADTKKSPILPSLANKIGRDEKFEWITGQLETENGNYVLYYATPETVDKYNGRIVLSPQQEADMSKFKRGDLVSVRGQLVQRSTTAGSMVIYRVSYASLIERMK